MSHKIITFPTEFEKKMVAIFLAAFGKAAF